MAGPISDCITTSCESVTIVKSHYIIGVAILLLQHDELKSEEETEIT